MNAVTPKRFAIAEYHQLIELGFLTEGDRIELIRGELIQMTAKGTPHTVCSSLICRQLDRLLGDQAVIRGQRFTQSTSKFKISILSQGVGLTFSALCG
ncbi:Uma2 family endonuclease [Nostoc sphaeroides CCNUC1]|uniref:Uma2 family endonuclease n=1 Tax=Nostoc sphaeroides CCNUC1 TaxID=2653204 RepID=A0A5P8W2U7_9NOSO|nr:Uma2 family endonuclease [Nostoc sphaeroides CCNUC1]